MKHVLILPIVLFFCQMAISQGVWINEIHYDNVSADVGEFVEIAGKAGTVLSDYKVVFYNGSNGSSYATINLNGTIDNEENDFGCLSFYQAGIQNGEPDGLALVDPTGTVIQFLSYEGGFTAMGGPADGMASENIGVAETSSTPIGESLQLKDAYMSSTEPNGVPNGDSYDDFEWNAPSTDSPGDKNDGQSFSVLAIVITALEISEENEAILLEWATFDETEVSHFDIEYSANGAPFEKIGSIYSNNSEEGDEYEFRHRDAKAYKNFYRIAQHNHDGTIDYTNIVGKTVKKKYIPVLVYPTAPKDFLNIEFGDKIEGKKLIQIVASNGQVVKQFETNGRNKLINVQDLASGNYYVKIQHDDTKTTKKIVIR